MKTDFEKFLSDEVKKYDRIRRKEYIKRTEKARKLNPQYRAIEVEKKKKEQKRLFREKLVELT